MSSLGNRLASRLRGKKALEAEITGRDAGTPDTSAAGTVRSPDAIYAAALTLLGNEHASGRLDGDLAAAGARGLGQVYHERHLAKGEAVAEGSRKALQTESTAYRIREELVGSGKHGAADSLLSSLDAAVSDLRRLLTAVRRQGESANRRNNGRPIQDQSLPGGWERSVVESIVKIQEIMSRMNQLAQAHEKAVSDFERARY